MPSSATTVAALRKSLRDFALSLPGTEPKSPWPGHDDVAVHDKTFVYLGGDDDGADRFSVGVKLRVSATRSSAGCWRATARRRRRKLLKALEAAQPWVAAGALPAAAPAKPRKRGRAAT